MQSVATQLCAVLGHIYNQVFSWFLLEQNMFPEKKKKSNNFFHLDRLMIIV